MDFSFYLSFFVPLVLLVLAAARCVPRTRLRAAGQDVVFLLGVLAALLADRWVLGYHSKDLLFLQRELAAELALVGGGDAFLSTATGLGKPVLAHPLLAALHPFSPVLLLPDPDLGIQLYVALHMAWGALWWWLVFSLEPATRGGRRSRWWIRAGVCLSLLNGFMTARIAGSQGMEYALAACWLPQALYALHLLLRKPASPLGSACLFALAMSSMAATSPNLTAAVLLPLVLFGGMTAASVRRKPGIRRIHRFGGLALTAGLCGLMMLPELLPAISLWGANDGFTYRWDPTGYRFRPYTGGELANTLLGLREPAYGRDVVFWIGLLPVGAVLAGLAGRLRPRRVLGALLLTGLAADWTLGGPMVTGVRALLPATRVMSLTPAGQALWAWTAVALFSCAAPARPRSRILGFALLVVLSAALLFPARYGKMRSGFDMAQEARLFAWTADLGNPSHPPLVADIQPLSEQAYLLPDPVARAQGIRTIGEDWYALLPRRFYEDLLPARRTDWSRLHAMGVQYVVSVYPENRAPALWRLIHVHDARAQSQAPQVRDTLFMLFVRWLERLEPAWDGMVRVYARIERVRGVAERNPEDGDNGYRPSRATRWLARAWIPLGVVLVPLLGRKRRR